MEATTICRKHIQPSATPSGGGIWSRPKNAARLNTRLLLQYPAKFNLNLFIKCPSLCFQPLFFILRYVADASGGNTAGNQPDGSCSGPCGCHTSAKCHRLFGPFCL